MQTKPRELSRGKPLPLYLSETEHKHLKVYSAARGETANEVIRYRLQDILEGYGNEKRMREWMKEGET